MLLPLIVFVVAPLLQSVESDEHYTLFAPIRSTYVYLIDEQGEPVHEWNTHYQPGHEARLLENGKLLHTGKLKHSLFRGGGQGGRLSVLAADGEVEWSWVLPEKYLQHHDVEVLPNGNYLAIAWEHKSKAQAEALGRAQDSVSRDGIWPDCLLEIKPIGKDRGEIVWEWHAWDHLVQDRDHEKPNFSAIGESPRRIDINLGGIDKRSNIEIDEETELLQALGYLGDDEEEEEETPPAPKKNNRPPGLPDHIGRGGQGAQMPIGGGRFQADWMHSNALAYNQELDLIAISLRHFSEVIVIDHSTTSEQAASSAGGNYAKGGDILWRWGNPQNYQSGDENDRKCFGQHDVRWIPTGFPGAGSLSIFNNGEKETRPWSSVEEIKVELAASNENISAGEVEWIYQAPQKEDLFSSHISGAIRLENGNTLITSGEQQRLFEVNPQHEVVWEFRPSDEQMTKGESEAKGFRNKGRAKLGNNRLSGPPRNPRLNRQGAKAGGGGGIFRAYRYAPGSPEIRQLFAQKSPLNR